MIQEILKALWQALLPVAITSFALTWWSLKQGYVSPGKSYSLFQSELKIISDSAKKKKARKGDQSGSDADDRQSEIKPVTDPLHRKWMKFGRGFYGVVAFQTYVVIEIGEIGELFGDLSRLILDLDVGVLISFFIESLKNFIMAIAWPALWLQKMPAEYLPIWLAAAWLGYRVGTQVALEWRNRAGPTEI